MAYKCLECGHIFEDGEEATWREGRGVFWGEPCSEKMSGCPLCRGGYEETVQCAVCGCEQLEEDLINGVCKECLEDYTDLDTCYDIGSKEKVAIEINSFFSAIFTDEEINEILYLAAKEKTKEDYKSFVEEDESWFVDMLRKEVLK